MRTTATVILVLITALGASSHPLMAGCGSTMVSCAQGESGQPAMSGCCCDGSFKAAPPTPARWESLSPTQVAGPSANLAPAIAASAVDGVTADPAVTPEPLYLTGCSLRR
ncbi:MAG: hypothetical protein U0166_00860 [Acidobacteriota bacterium]